MRFSVKKTHKRNHQIHFQPTNGFPHSNHISATFITKAAPLSKKNLINSKVVNKPQGFFQPAKKNLHGVIWSVGIFFLVSFVELRISAGGGFGAAAKPLTPPEHKYEEYYIEHEISSTQAKNSVMTYNINSLGPPPGCQKCTLEEIQYCGSSLMNDHCCCDKEYFEKLPFIPHTCYLGAQPCTPIQDCATYARLRDCCCNNILIKKWKAKSSANKLSGAILSLQLLIMLLLMLVLGI